MTGILLPVAVVIGVGVSLHMVVRIFRNPEFGVYVFVFLSSVTMMPELPFVEDRMIVADFVMLIALLAAAAKGTLFSRVPREFRAVDELALWFILICTVSSLVALVDSDDPGRVILFLAMYVYGYLCFRLILRVINTPQRFQRICLYWLAGAVLVIVVGFIASVGLYRPEWTYDPVIGRINSTMKMSGQVSSYIGPAFFILVYLATSRALRYWQRVVSVALIGAGCVVLLGTGGRTSLVIMIFSVLYGVLATRGARNLHLRRSLFMLAAVAGIVVFAGYAVSIWSDTAERYSQLTTSPFERAIRIFAESSREEEAGIEVWGGTRYDEISIALNNFWRHPLFGVGSGMFSSTYRINEIHNTYISILAENGIFAFVLFMLWWTRMGLLLWRRTHTTRAGHDRVVVRLVFGGFLALSIYQMTLNGMRQRPFWFVPAIAVCGLAVIRRSNVEMVVRTHDIRAYDPVIRRPV